jgi:DNA polymerase
MIPKPPKLENFLYGQTLRAGMGTTTVLADIDFETYSEAGFIWNKTTQRYQAPPNAVKKGLPTIGAAVYSEHPSTEVLSCAYDLKDGKGKRLWLPSHVIEPWDLFEHIASGRLLEAWNVSFERWIWINVCMPKYHWPPVPWDSWRCAAAKSVAHAMPKSLDPAGTVLNIKHKKHKDGVRLLTKFSMPHNPTISNPQTRIRVLEDYADAEKLYAYNLQDIAAEAELSSLIPDLIPSELEFWKCDQAINYRGVMLDHRSILNAIKIIEQAHKKYNSELSGITGGTVKKASEIAKIRAWAATQGVVAHTLDEEKITELLATEIPAGVRRVFEIRQLIGSAAVKKLYAMHNKISKTGRIHDLFLYHSARTGRAAGVGVQPQNLPNSGLETSRCPDCDKQSYNFKKCPWCGQTEKPLTLNEWNPEAVEDALVTINTGSLTCVEYHFKDAIATVSGCLRGLFISAPKHDLICSDYSAIEAVVLAELAGEKWRKEVFRTHGKIYEASVSKITGRPLQEYLDYKNSTGKHHPDRKLGKVAELSSGYQGWIGAWKAFGADAFFTDEEIKKNILAWRAASPAIVEFWGGQTRRWKPEFYGTEGAAVQAVMFPGEVFTCQGIAWEVRGQALYCKLLSGRYLTYHRPRLVPSARNPDALSLSFEGWNSNAIYGAPGWMRIETWGGRLVENVVQATARDILAHAIVALERAAYPVVLHVHDEIVSEVPEKFGSVGEFEKIMSTMPAWAADWPVKAQGGWRAKRYSK